MNKVFCIGLPKTGTTSLHHGAKILGLRSVHWPQDERTVEELRGGNYNLSIAKKFDVFSDIPIPAIFPQLDRAFPGSKFILTTRDKVSWLTSQRSAGFNQDTPRPGSSREFYRTLLYGVNKFNEERFSWVYDEHHRLVERYFSGSRSADLLKFDIVGGAGWEPLCKFLNLPVPHNPFPRSNVMGEDQPSVRYGSRISRSLQGFVMGRKR